MKHSLSNSLELAPFTCITAVDYRWSRIAWHRPLISSFAFILSYCMIHRSGKATYLWGQFLNPTMFFIYQSARFADEEEKGRRTQNRATKYDLKDKSPNSCDRSNGSIFPCPLFSLFSGYATQNDKKWRLSNENWFFFQDFSLIILSLSLTQWGHHHWKLEVGHWER